MGKLLTLILLFALISCQTESQKVTGPKTIDLITPNGETIETILALSMEDQEQGLSGVKSEDFDNNQGMLFYYPADGEKNFWMPDTYFDLDLFYLDKDFKIVEIIRKLPHYRGRLNPQLIPRARAVWCRHTLEMKSGSKIADTLKVGHQLRWRSPELHQQIESKIRRQQ